MLVWRIVKPSLLAPKQWVIKTCHWIVVTTKSDLYEYLLNKLTTAGINGQFRTPPIYPRDG